MEIFISKKACELIITLIKNDPHREGKLVETIFTDFAKREEKWL
jgi:hypothetical protein